MNGRATPSVARLLAALMLLAVSAAAPIAAAADTAIAPLFDHLTTGFELLGQHRDLACETCHVNAVFKGTPRDCSACHGVGTSVRATAKANNHILSSDRCDACHNTNAWVPAVSFDHVEVRGSCSTCHNNVQAQGMGPGHIQTNLECNVCHSTISWAGAVFNHAGVTGNCASCHNGISATGLPPTHIPTGGAPCESCHSPTNFTDWTGATMNHTVVSSMPCAACHEAGKSFIGVTIVTRPPAPHPTTGDCGQCHSSTTSFKVGTLTPSNHIPLPAADGANCTLCHSNANDYSVYTMNHVNIATNCAQCHAAGLSFTNMAPPTLKETPANHIPIGTVACEACHSPTTFTTFAGTAMNHAAVPGVACASCHAQGKTFVAPVITEPGNHIPIGTVACESCHSPTTFTTFAGTAMNHANFKTNCIACHGVGLAFVGTPAVKTFPANHIPTGTIACESCHSNANFTSFAFTNASGTAPPSMVHSVASSIACSTCHEAGKAFIGAPPIVVRPPPPGHVTTGECSTCHFSTTSFLGASNLPVGHIPMPAADGANCTLCHSNANDYSVYTMNHVNIATNCAQCHAAGLSFTNMAPPTLKETPANHIPIGTVACEACHSPTTFTTFAGTAMNHAAVPGVACASCHAQGKTFVAPVITEPGNHIPIGTVACESCHSPTTFTTFAGTAMNHANFKTNCIACHGVGLAFVGTPAVKTFPANHIPTGTIACESCHSNANFTSFAFTNASGTAPPSMVHSVVSSIACSTCHEAGKAFIGAPPIVVRPPPPGHVATGECSTCHFSTTSFLGASNLPVGHIPLPAADGANCTLCHSNANDYSVYTMNHVNIATNCAQCHAAGLSFTNMAPPTLKETPANHIPIGTVACEACHSPTTFTTFAGTAMNHAAVPGVACASCHAQGKTFVAPVITEPGNHIPIGTVACESCHSPTTFTTFAGTAMNHANFKTNCIACHGVGLAFVGTPAVKTFPANHIPTGTIACESCHSNANFTSFAFTNASGTAPPSMVHSVASSIACSTCHEAGKAFIGAPPIVVRPPPPGHVATGECSNCHFSTTSFLGATNLPPNHIPIPAADGANCALCHTNASDFSVYTMNHVNIASNCAQCHGAGLSFANMAPPTLKEPPTGTPPHIPVASNVACELCHSATNFTTFSGTVMRHAAVPGKACDSCHEFNMAWYGEPNLWTRPSAGHHAGQDCGGSGCHTARDKRAVRPAAAGVALAVRPQQALAAVGAGAAAAASPGVSGGRLAVGLPAPFNHLRIGNTNCASCHNGIAATGKPPGHVATTNDCSSCHTTLSWVRVARVDHMQVLGNCATCHNAVKAVGKPITHVATAADCGVCHTSNAWVPARVDHSALSASARCRSCHDGVHAIGVPANHVPTTQECSACHGTLAWAPAKVDHRTLTARCASCHNNIAATGMTSRHMVTMRDCATCHSYPDWNLVAYRHQSGAYPGDHRVALSCASCHSGNSEQVPFSSPTNAGSCAGCHARDFKPEAHPKTLKGQLYSASELHDCTGACHVYSDSNGGIAKSPTAPFHRVTDAAFKH